MRALTLAALVLVLAPWGAGASEGIYRYVESDGTIIYTNVPPPSSKRARKLKGTFRAAPGPSNTPVRPRDKFPEEYESHILSSAKRYRIPTSLVRAVIHVESNFDPTAVSPKGASGLMQLMPETAAEMYVKDIFDARENIEGGTRYLRVLANLFEGDMVKMVAAYNAGPDAVKKYGGQVPPYAETQEYVRKVLKLYFLYKERETSKVSGPREATSDGDDGAGAEEPH